MIGPFARSPTLRDLMEAIATGDVAEAERLLAATPDLATDQLVDGATRQEPLKHFLPTLECYLYKGDSALHIAAAAWQPELLRKLIACGAKVMVRNRRGATPLHHAASGNPDSSRWDPLAQAATIAMLIAEGADPNATDDNGSTPLHKAIRTRCASATDALLRLGADSAIRTRNGSTCRKLASVPSGRGGSGSRQAKEQQARIVELLGRQDGASSERTVRTDV